MESDDFRRKDPADKDPLAAIVARSRPSELRATSSDLKPDVAGIGLFAVAMEHASTCSDVPDPELNDQLFGPISSKPIRCAVRQSGAVATELDRSTAEADPGTVQGGFGRLEQHLTRLIPDLDLGLPEPSLRLEGGGEPIRTRRRRRPGPGRLVGPLEREVLVLGRDLPGHDLAGPGRRPRRTGRRCSRPLAKRSPSSLSGSDPAIGSPLSHPGSRPRSALSRPPTRRPRAFRRD